MRKAAFLLLAVIIVAWFVIRWRNRPPELGALPPSGGDSASLATNSVLTTVETQASPQQATAAADSRPGIQLMLRFAAAAPMHNFDPTVTSYSETNNRWGHETMVATRTHTVSILNGRITDFVSARDCSNPLNPADETVAAREWYKCTGTWTEQEALAQTRAILQRLDDREPLFTGVRYAYNAEIVRAKDPNGKTVPVTPFATIRLYDRDERMLVQAEYRMSSNGSAGLVWWFRNR